MAHESRRRSPRQLDPRSRWSRYLKDTDGNPAVGIKFLANIKFSIEEDVKNILGKMTEARMNEFSEDLKK